MISRSIAARRGLLALAMAALGATTARADITSSGDITPANPSTWTSTTTGYIGNTSTGLVTVGAGGQLQSSSAVLGNGAGGDGTVIVDGASASWMGLSVSVGVSGSGTLQITGGAQAAFLAQGLPPAAATCIVAYRSGSNGMITVSGTGSSLTLSQEFDIGASGTATLNILNGGVVANMPNLSTSTFSYTYLGKSAGSLGQATVDGAGSTLAGGVLYVGSAGTGSLTISNGGLVSNQYATYVNPATGSVNFGANGGTLATQTLYATSTDFSGIGTVNTRGLVTDANLVFDASHGLQQTLTWQGSQQNVTVNLDLSGESGAVGDLCAGYQGTGSLAIRDGRVVHSIDGYLGYAAGSTGTATVDGAASAWTPGELFVGDFGNGTLNIINGANVMAGTTLVAASSSAAGKIDFGTHGGTLTSVVLYAAPSQFTGTGTIVCEGIVTDGNLVFDASHGLAQTFNWTNAGQNVTVNLDVSSGRDPVGVGYQGVGTLTIAGVSVSSQVGYLGYGSGASGVAMIDGANSIWNSGSLYCGLSGAGLMKISNGGVVHTSIGELGLSSGATGTVFVDGAGSAWTVTNQLIVGNRGIGAVHITNGGTVTCQTVELDSGTVTVDGAGSTWNISSYLEPGGFCTVAITHGGHVSAGQLIMNFGLLLAVNVGDGSSVSAGAISSSGIVHLDAVPGATAGTYTPIVAGTWSGSGTVQALGGSWNTASHQFTVSPAASATTGQAVTFDTIATQRVVITDPSADGVQAGFQATAASSSLTFTAWELTQDQTLLLENTVAVGTQVLDGWMFAASGYTAGSPVFLSLKVGPGYSASGLEVWHYDGTSWTLYPTSDLSYDGTYANFTVTGFSGYAVTTVAPEPASLGMLAVSGSLLLRRRKAGAAGGETAGMREARLIHRGCREVVQPAPSQTAGVGLGMRAA